MTNYVDAALNDMSEYRAKRKQVKAEVTKLETQINELKSTLIKPDMSKHIQAVNDELETKKHNFMTELKKTVMSDDFTSKWQMRAISAFGQTKHVQSADDLFRIDGGAAAMAYMLTGQLDNAVLKLVMPHSDIFNYVQTISTMCNKLGILEDEIENIVLDIEFIDQIKYFAGV